MKIQGCSNVNDETGQCVGSVSWIDPQEVVEAGQQAADQPWLTGEDAVTVALAIGGVWAAAWALRAIAQQLQSYLR
ncbi:hypothetical protein [Halomonas elongata]|uniref:hypothetical protein n=1 Tax=Halomonas elongata TaxID=2746 RepID=UPI0040339C3D